MKTKKPSIIIIIIILFLFLWYAGSSFVNFAENLIFKAIPDNVPGIVAFLLLLLLAAILIFLWGSYFYRIWKIKRMPVKISRVGNLPDAEKKKTLKELRTFKNQGAKAAITFFIFISSLVFFVWGIKSGEDMGGVPDGFAEIILTVLSGWGLIIAILASLFLFTMFFGGVLYRKNLKKDLNEGVVQIKGKLFKTKWGLLRLSLQFPLSDMTTRHLRIGKFSFLVKNKELRTVWDNLVRGNTYVIEFKAGTKEILKINKSEP